MAKKLTAAKAREILHDKEVHGHPLTDKQRRYFGAVASGHNWLNKYENGGLQEYQENYNEPSVSYPPGFVGMNNNTKGFNYNSAWGGRWENGGMMPGANAFMYARHGAPSEGPHAKKTMPSAENGTEMRYYQAGLDFQPKTISEDGSEIPKFQLGGMAFVPGKQQEQVASQVLNMFGEVMSAPQKGLTYLATGKYQTPAEAMHIKNPYAKFATDVVLDPVNLLGAAGIVDKMAPKFVAKAERLAGEAAEAVGKTAKYNIGAAKEHSIGLTRGLKDIRAGRPISEIFPITKAQKANITAKQDQALQEGLDFVDKWFYDPDVYGPMRQQPRELIENMNPLSPYNNTSKFSNVGPFGGTIENPLNKYSNTLISSRSRDIPKQGLSDYNMEYLRENRGDIAGFNSDPNAYTLRNYGFYQRSPEDIRSTVMHEVGHSAEQFGEVWRPWSQEIAHYDPQFPYRIANPETSLGRKFGQAMVQPTKPGQYLWEGSPGEVYAEMFPARYKEAQRLSEVLEVPLEKVIPFMQEHPERTASNLLQSGRFERFFKKGTTDAEKIDLLKVLPAAAPVAVGAAAAQKQRDGGVTKDNRGYWNPDNWGKPVEIDSNQITMQGVNQPLLGISDTGDTKMMAPGKDYRFKGKKVTEFPVAEEGASLQLDKLDQLTNFTNYNKPTRGGWLDKYQ